MCGIIGYLGKKNALDVLIDGLKNLEYRGYDSAGIAYVENNQIKIIKEKGKISNLESKIDFNKKIDLGIGHTRWATHGKANQINAHPHQVGKITLVHNGIVENYEQIKNELIQNNYHFNSDTDTEVICALIDYLYQQTNNMLDALNQLKNKVKGTYALCIINKDEINSIYAIRKDSPLILATKNYHYYIASDIPAILKYTNQYYLLENNEVIKINKQNIEIYNDNLEKIEKEINTFTSDITTAQKDGYEHYMLKEINEEALVIKNTMFPFIENKIKSLSSKIPDLKKYNQINIVACGSAYNAGLVGQKLIEKHANIPCKVEIASEYRYNKLFFDQKTLLILVSQSGETADTLAALRIAKENNIDTLAIINTVGSSIAREAKYVLYIKAGCEIAVATTKAYCAQIAMFTLIALNIAIDKQLIKNEEFESIINNIYKLPNIIKKQCQINYKNLAQKIAQYNDIFFLGRGIDLPLALEGSLKLKEISYIHSEAYPAGELKHGTISLIKNNTPVISIITDKHIASKTLNNIKEVKTREAMTILIITKDLDNDFDCIDEKIVIPNIHPILQPIITIIPMQLLSYEIAYLRGCDIDKPRNLAKSVTVE